MVKVVAAFCHVMIYSQPDGTQQDLAVNAVTPCSNLYIQLHFNAAYLLHLNCTIAMNCCVSTIVHDIIKQKLFFFALSV